MKKGGLVPVFWIGTREECLDADPPMRRRSANCSIVGEWNSVASWSFAPNLFSIWAKNALANTALAAGQQTFAHGFLEAISLLHAGG